MKISVQLALVAVFALLNLSWSEEEAAQEERPATTAESMFTQFCGMAREDRVLLLTCLGRQLPDVVQDIGKKGYSLDTLPDTVCNTENESFPIALVLYLGKALPHISSCLPLQKV
uniref:Putative secreted protein n=1 Tax=Amblyomma americanum TaxID=6943 RepID=A0A0C9SET7_AMBAM